MNEFVVDGHFGLTISNLKQEIKSRKRIQQKIGWEPSVSVVKSITHLASLLVEIHDLPEYRTYDDLIYVLGHATERDFKETKGVGRKTKTQIEGMLYEDRI